MVESRSSLRVGQLTLVASTCTSLTNSRPRAIHVMSNFLHSRRGSSHSSRRSPASELAGLEGFEPPTPGFGDRCSSRTELQACLRSLVNPLPLSRLALRAVILAATASPAFGYYRVSLCAVCLRQNGQNLRNSTRSGWSRLFLVVM